MRCMIVLRHRGTLKGNLFLFILPANKAPKSMASKIPPSYQTLITLSKTRHADRLLEKVCEPELILFACLKTDR